MIFSFSLGYADLSPKPFYGSSIASGKSPPSKQAWFLMRLHYRAVATLSFNPSLHIWDAPYPKTTTSSNELFVSGKRLCCDWRSASLFCRFYITKALVLHGKTQLVIKMFSSNTICVNPVHCLLARNRFQVLKRAEIKVVIATNSPN